MWKAICHKNAHTFSNSASIPLSNDVYLNFISTTLPSLIPCLASPAIAVSIYLLAVYETQNIGKQISRSHFRLSL